MAGSWGVELAHRSGIPLPPPSLLPQMPKASPVAPPSVGLEERAQSVLSNSEVRAAIPEVVGTSLHLEF